MPITQNPPIGFNDIQNEFGGTNPVGINEYYAGGSLVPAGTKGYPGGVEVAIPTSGQIAAANFFGAAKVNLITIALPFLNLLKSDYPGRSNAGTSSDPIYAGTNLYPGDTASRNWYPELYDQVFGLPMPQDLSGLGYGYPARSVNWPQSNFYDSTGGAGAFWYLMLNNEPVLDTSGTNTGPPDKSQGVNSNSFQVSATSSSLTLRVQQDWTSPYIGEIPFLSLQSLGTNNFVGRYGDGMRFKFTLTANCSQGLGNYWIAIYLRNDNLTAHDRRRGIFICLGNTTAESWNGDPNISLKWPWRVHGSVYHPGFHFKFQTRSWYNSNKLNANAPTIPAIPDSAVNVTNNYELWIDDIINTVANAAGRNLGFANSNTEILGIEFAVEQGWNSSVGPNPRPGSGQHFTQATLTNVQAFRERSQGFPLYGPTAEFYASATSISQGGTVTFRNLSYNRASGGDWYINGIYYSSSRNFNYTFNSTGNYTVTLTVTNPEGQTNSKSINVSVVYSPSVHIFNSSQNWTVPSGASWWVLFAISAGGRGGAAVDNVPNGEYQGAGGGGGGGGIWYVSSNEYGNFSAPGSQVLSFTIGSGAISGGRGASTVVSGLSQTFTAEGGYGGNLGENFGGAGGNAGPLNAIYGGYVGAQPEGFDTGGGGGGAGGHAPSDFNPGGAGLTGGIAYTFTIGGQTFSKGAGGLGGISGQFVGGSATSNSGDGGRGAGSAFDSSVLYNGQFGGSGVVILYA